MILKADGIQECHGMPYSALASLELVEQDLLVLMRKPPFVRRSWKHRLESRACTNILSIPISLFVFTRTQDDECECDGRE